MPGAPIACYDIAFAISVLMRIQVRHPEGNMPVSSPDAATKTMIDNMPEKTGRSLDQWLKLLRGRKFEKHGDIVRWLKGEHGVTHGFANLIAHMHRNAGAVGGGANGGLVEAQYRGARAELRPIYDAIIKKVTSFGDDVQVAPKKTYVSLRRRKQFALIQPSTKDRIDVGIQLKGMTASGRLEFSGSFNAMVSHRVRITKKSEIDAELVGWLRQAYDAA